MRDSAEEGRTMLVVTHEMALLLVTYPPRDVLTPRSMEEQGDPAKPVTAPESERLQHYLFNLLISSFTCGSVEVNPN